MADATSDVTGTVTASRDFKVKLTRAASVGTGNVERVTWDATPELSESRSIMYKNIDPLHAPGAIYQYASTGSRTFSIQGKFVSRSINEATKTLAYVQYLRTWAMPVFGNAGTAPGETILGAPPAILLLTAYSRGHPLKGTQTTVDTTNPINGKTANKQYALGNNLFEIPVVITSLEIPFPSDVDYIPTVNGIPVPTIVTVSLQLVETHSPRKYLGFNIDDFKNGNLVNF